VISGLSGRKLLIGEIVDGAVTLSVEPSAAASRPAGSAPEGEEGFCAGVPQATARANAHIIVVNKNVFLI
jgi:hypothetical protein